MQFYVILPDIRSFIQVALTVQEIIGNLPVVNNNQKLLAKFHFGTLRIIGTMRLLSLFYAILCYLTRCTVIYTSGLNCYKK